jgi:peptide/nickel transport system substrate-binding protein
MQRGKRTLAAVAAVGLLSTAAACQTAKGTRSPAPARGGTLNVILTQRAIQTLDPQEVSFANDANFSRLIDRTLTTTAPDGLVVPDLATDTGRPSENNTVWEFTLKNGVRWDDGSPVTCDDLKYGIERRYSKVIADAGGLPYPMLYLKDNPTPYKGPQGLGSLASIVCADQHTVDFHLQRPVGDFGYTVSVSTFAPVKVGSDAGGRKTDDPFRLDPSSNGPYKVDHTQTKIEDVNGISTITNMVLVRNDYWDAGTDTVRKAYPDTIAVTFDTNNVAVTNNLINSTGIYRNAINLDQDVASNFVQQVINDPELSKRAIAGPAGGTTYIAINTLRVKDYDCRAALEYAFDKRSLRFVLGGAVVGDLAATMIPPSLAAHSKIDPYGTANFPDGDVDTANKLMAKAKCATTVTVAFPDIPIRHQEVNTIADAYFRIGVHVVPKALDRQTYIDQFRDPKNKFDMMLTGWVPDWTNGSAIIPTLFDGGQLHRSVDENFDFSELDKPDVNRLIAEAEAEPVLATQYKLWGDIDVKVVKEYAAVIPILYPNALRMMGTNVRGVVISAGYGEPDLALLGLGPGS